MRSRLLWMILTGLGLALILLVIVQATSFLSSTSDIIDGDPQAPISDTVPDTGLTPVFFRTISEYNVGAGKKLRINGTSEPEAVLSLLNQNTRLRQLKADEDGNWDVEIDILGNDALALELVMFVEGGLSIRGDETVYRIPVPQKKDEETSENAALIMVSAPGGPTRIVQSPFGGSPTNGPLTMGPIDYDDSGGVIFSGTTEEEGRVRIYAGGAAVGETRVGAGGRWNFIAGKLLPRGEYPVSAELIRPDGVKARVTVPFELLPPSRNAETKASDLPDVKYDPFRWQVRRKLLGGGFQSTVIFAPEDSKALIVQE